MYFENIPCQFHGNFLNFLNDLSLRMPSLSFRIGNTVHTLIKKKY